MRLVGVSKTTHTRHDTENVVVGGIDTNLGGLGALYCSIGQHELESSIVNAGEVATATWLMFLGPQREGINVDTSVRSLSVVLVRLDKVKVSAFALRETILAVKLELSGDNRVLTPAVQVKRSLSEDEGTGIRNTRVLEAAAGRITGLTITRTQVGLRVVIILTGITRTTGVSTLVPPVRRRNINGTSLGKETRSINE
jgi:hypothetical protein